MGEVQWYPVGQSYERFDVGTRNGIELVVNAQVV